MCSYATVCASLRRVTAISLNRYTPGCFPQCNHDWQNAVTFNGNTIDSLSYNARDYCPVTRLFERGSPSNENSEDPPAADCFYCVQFLGGKGGARGLAV